MVYTEDRTFLLEGIRVTVPYFDEKSVVVFLEAFPVSVDFSQNCLK